MELWSKCPQQPAGDSVTHLPHVTRHLLCAALGTEDSVRQDFVPWELAVLQSCALGSKCWGYSLHQDLEEKARPSLSHEALLTTTYGGSVGGNFLLQGKLEEQGD